jgi:hypothetical protein
MRGLAVLGIFLAAFVVLSWGAGAPGIASGYVDPVAKIQAQDEAVYGSTAFGMAAEGGWLTPRFLGRYVLYKPPLLYWISGISVKALGRTALALRMPSLIAGAAVVALVFAWAGLEAALLLLSSHLFFVLSRLGLMDALLTFEITAAVFVLTRDPKLHTRLAVWGFGLASAAALMTKGIAGVLPLLILLAFAALSRQRPHAIRITQAIAIATIFAAPSYIYQIVIHPHWFWAEFVQTEILSWGLAAPEQTTSEAHWAFYGKRLFLLDPILLAALVFALVRWRPKLPLVWLSVVFGADTVFQYRNVAYLLPAYPAMAIIGGGAIPRRGRGWILAAALGMFVVKAAEPKQPWGLPFSPEFVNRSYAALDRYAALHRGNDLILIQPDDQFYSACLPLAHVRYVYLDPRPSRPRLPLDFEYLGISVTVPDFNSLAELRPIFEQRLREFDLYSNEAIAGVILARTQDEITELMNHNPEADYFIDGEFRLSSKVIQRP